MVGVPESCGFGESIAVVVLALRCPRETVAHREPRRIVGRRFDQDCVGVRRIERAQIRVQIARKFGGVAACRNPDALEIGRSLDISIETVKEHVQNILRKLEAGDRTEAAVWAVKKGLV